MTWLDRVLAVPTVGCGFKPWPHFSNDYLAALRPLITRWQQRGDGEVSIKVPNPGSLELRTSGFSYAITTEKFSVQYNYAIEVVDRPGQIPELRPTAALDKYSVLLRSALNEAGEVAEHLLGSATRPLVRIGIVVQSRLDGESLPPGVSAFIRHLQSPWGNGLSKCQTHLLAPLAETENGRDRCHHIIDIDEDRKNDVRLTLDWQRIMPEPVEIRANKLKEQMENCSKAALEYFELFGKGELTYAGTH